MQSSTRDTRISSTGAWVGGLLVRRQSRALRLSSSRTSYWLAIKHEPHGVTEPPIGLPLGMKLFEYQNSLLAWH